MAGAPALRAAAGASRPRRRPRAKPAQRRNHRKAAHGKNRPYRRAARRLCGHSGRRSVSPSRPIWSGSAVTTAWAPRISTAHTVDAIKAFQRRNNGKETGVLSDQERAALADAAKAPQAAVGWRLIDDTATGARLGLPEKLVPQAGAARTGSRWTSAQGQIQIETFRLREASLPALFEDEKKRARSAQVGYSELDAEFLRHCRRAGAEEIRRPRAIERQRSARRHHPLRSGDRRHHGAGRDRGVRYVSRAFPIRMPVRCRDESAASNTAPRSW